MRKQLEEEKWQRKLAEKQAELNKRSSSLSFHGRFGDNLATSCSTVAGQTIKSLAFGGNRMVDKQINLTSSVGASGVSLLNNAPKERSQNISSLLGEVCPQ